MGSALYTLAGQSNQHEPIEEKTSQDKTIQDKTIQDKTIQDKTIQDKIIQDVRVSTLPSSPKNDAQVFEVGKIIYVKLHRWQVGDIIEEIINMAEYWPAVSVSSDARLLPRSVNWPFDDQGDIILGPIPRMPHRLLLKFHMRFCIACGHAPHTPEAHAANDLPEPVDSRQALLKDVPQTFRRGFVNHLEQPRTSADVRTVSGRRWTYAAVKSPRPVAFDVDAKGLCPTLMHVVDFFPHSYSSFLFHPNLYLPPRTYNGFHSPGWVDEAFYRDGRADTDVERVIIKTLQLMMCAEGERSELRVIRGEVHGASTEWHAEAALYLKPRVNFDAWTVDHSPPPPIPEGLSG